MSKMAKILCLGEKTLSRTVDYSLGISAKTWLRHVRIVLIRQSLQSGGKLEFVAREFGFCQHSDMTREFKSLTGLTPSEYMRLASAFGELKWA